MVRGLSQLRTDVKQVISPGFDLCCPLARTSFVRLLKVGIGTVLCNAPMRNCRSWPVHHPCTGQLLQFLIGAFKKPDGRGTFHRKCGTQPKDQACLPCRIGFSVSNEEMRAASGHFTLNNCMVELRKEESHISHLWRSWTRPAGRSHFLGSPSASAGDPDASCTYCWDMAAQGTAEESNHE